MLRATCLLVTVSLSLACSGSDVSTSVSAPLATGQPRQSAASGYNRVDLGTLGGSSSYAAAISSGGAVVGWSETSTRDNHAFLWTSAAGMVDLGTLPGDRTSQAVAILDDSPTGEMQVLGVSGGRAVIWTRSGSIQVLPVSAEGSASSVFPQGFNARGDVVGFDSGVNFGQHAWIWSATDGKSELTSAGQTASAEGNASAINSEGVALVSAAASTCTKDTQCWRSYLWSKSSGYLSLGVPHDDFETSVTGLAINNVRTVVGWTERLGAVVAYRWTPATGFTVLPTYSSAMYAYAAGVNDGGNTVGAALEPAGSIVATLWPATGGVQKLSPRDPNPSVALAINAAGAIAGWATVPGGANHAVIWQPVPLLSNPQLGTSDPSLSADLRSAREPQSPLASSAGCLKRIQSLQSRQALFTCVIESDRTRLIHSR